MVKKEIEQLDKKLLKKEKTEILVQSYVFQALGQSRENAFNRQSGLNVRLRQKEMELKYYTKPAVIISKATPPGYPIAPNKRKMVLMAMVIGLMFSVFLHLLLNVSRKYLCKNSEIYDKTDIKEYMC